MARLGENFAIFQLFNSDALARARLSRSGENRASENEILGVTWDALQVTRDGTSKVLRCLDRACQPKVMAIVESKDLDSMTLATLFGKLQEHEMELGHSTLPEESDKNKKSISIKAKTSQSQ
ncbi:hypothetical protein Lal_00013753 [Lupinus albus]|nr:hypothetical protein Lal_00013753 [Lupinus albus]